jgi:histidinol phosphatase-like enzyme
MKYVIDIDGTICTQKNSNYEMSSPIIDRIDKINKLYDEGHIIIYFTARGMGRYSDDEKLANARFREITELQLKSWGCKYHKLVLGKPSGDYYIDDKGINSDEFFGN